MKPRSPASRYDMIVLGGGTGGLVASLVAAGAGARVALVERERTGGDCLWTGCVPSKALIASARLAQAMRRADALGLPIVEPEIDFGEVMRRVRATRERIAPHDSPERLRREGVEVIQAHGRFTGPDRIEAGGRALRFRTAVIATGSQPAVPPVPGLAEAEPLTNETVWDLERLPERLVVLGGGAVGVELGQAFARLGSVVTLVEMLPRLLFKEEPRAGELVAERLEADGVDVRTATRAGMVTAAGRPTGGRAGYELELAGGKDRVVADRILVAAGRQPQTDGLGLDAAAVATGDGGAVVVDSRLRTTAPRIYAVGDVTGALPFTHVAAYHARLAATNALFHTRRRVDYRAVPWATFTDPEVGRVGMTELDARERWGAAAKAVEFDYGELDRAVTEAEPHGFVKLVGDPRGRLVGATVVAAGGAEAVAELAAWVSVGAKIDRVSQTVHAYPTWSEGPARAADEYLRAKWMRPGVKRVTKPLLRLLRLV